MIANKPILVTGMPRSGTSWVGRMISQAPLVRHVHEPLNISSRPCRCGVKFDYWFHYLSPENLPYFHSHLKHTIFPAFNRIGLLNLITELVQSKRIRPISRYVQSHLFFRAVVKDPIAIFSAKTLAGLFNMDVVILIRHPAAIVSSYKSLNWTHSFAHFLNQPELMEDHLAPFRSEIEAFAKNEYDVVDQAALLWKLIHSMIIQYQETQPDWVFVRYEELAVNPIEGFHKIFNRLRLPLTKRMRRTIQGHSLQNQPPNAADPYIIKQDPHQVISKWKTNLTSAEIHRIRARVEDVSSTFFTDDDWNLEPVRTK
jgi:hypothetical protein